MKRFFFFIPGFWLLLLASCSKDSPIPVEPDPCGAIPLGITEAAIQLDPELAAQVPSFDSTWSWTRTVDTLIVAYRQHGWCTSGQIRYLNFVISDCPRLVRDYMYSYNFILTDTPIVSSSIQDYELNFELQEWDEQGRIIGRNGDTEIWVDFNADNMY